ncbi:MAG TPA: alginate lyase family protein [Candidatus Binatia bacterium]|nr:alginate lyase family protein [Candidatus Binatia bacterium]
MLNQWAVVALPLACILAAAGCSTPVDLEPVSFSAPLAVERVAELSLPAEERAALLRAAAAALERSPNPLPVVHTEGTLPTLPAYQRAAQVRRDWRSISVLANAYAMDREPRHLDGYARYLTAWLDVYRISGNPIDETALGEWLLAYRSAGPALPPSLPQRMRQFACDLAVRYTQSQPGSRKTSTNNWQSHRVKLAVMGAHVCRKPALIAAAEAVFARQIEDNLLPSGETVDFAERDAIHYAVYSVEPLLEAALFVHRQGQALFATVGSKGQSIGRTLEWLAPYARGDKTHEEFVHSRVPFDAQRAAAGVAGFSGPFSSQKAQLTFWLAAQMDPKWLELSRTLGTPSITQRASWLLQ